MSQEAITIELLQHIHNGKTHIGNYLSLIFKNLPISVGWKDKNLIHQGCNQFQADICGIRHPDEVIGKDDFAFLPESEAHIFIKDDQQVIQNCTAKFNMIRPAHFLKGQSIVANLTKFPLLDEDNNVTGIVRFAHVAPLPTNNPLPQFQKGDKYFMEIDGKAISLTARQAECLTHLSMGKTIKQIANLLDCATSTIEDHINRLKKKLHVHTTSTLIDCFWKNPIKWF